MDNQSKNNIDPDEILSQSIALRNALANHIANKGHDYLLNDTDTADIYIKLLKDNDHVALTLQRIKSDNENLDKVLQQKELVNQMLKSLDPSKYDQKLVNTNKRSLEEDDGEREYIDGEMFVGVANLTVDNYRETTLPEDDEDEDNDDDYEDDDD